MLLIVKLLLLVSYNILEIKASAAGCPNINTEDQNEVIQSINMQITCGGENITAKINTCAFSEMGYNATEDVSIAGFAHPRVENGTICSLTKRKEGDYLFLTMTNFSACNTDVYPSDATILYVNAVRTVQFSNTQNKLIRRARSVYLPFGCKYRRIYNATIGDYEVDPGEVVIVPVADQVGSTDLSMQLCCDVHCSNGPIQPSDEIGRGDLVYFVATSASTQLIEIVAVWASTSPDPEDDSDRYYVAEDGCPNHFSTLVISMVPFEAYAKFVMFSLVPNEEAELYFHATVELCDADQMVCHQSECDDNPRYKREDRSSKPTYHTVTFGSFTYIPKPEGMVADSVTANALGV